MNDITACALRSHVVSAVAVRKGTKDTLGGKTQLSFLETPYYDDDMTKDDCYLLL